jgi:hypothetical protein
MTFFPTMIEVTDFNHAASVSLHGMILRTLIRSVTPGESSIVTVPFHMYNVNGVGTFGSFAELCLIMHFFKHSLSHDVVISVSFQVLTTQALVD